MMSYCSEKHNELVCRCRWLVGCSHSEYIYFKCLYQSMQLCAAQCVWFTVNLQWFPGAHQEVVTRELAEHCLVVRTDQENSGSVHSTGAGIDNLAGMVEQSGQCGL